MVYGTAGFGWVKLKDNYNTLGTAGKNGNFSSSKWAPAFVVGGGIEHMITPNWSIKGEFLYLKIESQTAAATDTSYYTSSPAIAVNYTNNLSIARVGVNYKFY
jgi:outer membrane immunogenic protein